MTAVRERTGVAATAGIGPNMFLAKVALDVTAKHACDGIGVLDEEAFRREVWFHRPITDIWGIGPGTARRLAGRGIFDLAGVCAERPQAIRAMFGRNGEYLLDHAWGLEPATIADCRSYVPRARSLSNGQVLMRDYGFSEARTVVREMVYESCLDLARGMLACDTVGVWAGYSGTALRGWDGAGEPPAAWAGGQRRLGRVSASERLIADAVMGLFDARVSHDVPIRRVQVALAGVVPDRMGTLTLFDDPQAEELERRLAETAVAVRRRFGPNALLRATSLMPGANARERNLRVGGHRA